MIAATVGYDLIFLVHIVVAIATIVILVSMRFSALSIVRGADEATQRARFTHRTNWAARLFHLLPVTGLLMSLTGNASVSLTKPWIGVGILIYFLGAAHLEARTLPLERVVGEVVQHDGVASPARGRQLVKSLDILLMLIALALVAMIVQF